MSHVTVITNPETGLIVSPLSNPEKGFIMVETTTETYNINGWFDVQRRVARINGDLELLMEKGFKEGQKLVGQIVLMESHTPFYEGQQEKRYPDSHAKAGEPVLKDGKLQYRRTAYVQSLAVEPYQWVEPAEPVQPDTKGVPRKVENVFED